MRSDTTPRLSHVTEGIELILEDGGQRLRLVGTRRADTLDLRAQEGGIAFRATRSGPVPPPLFREESVGFRAPNGTRPATLVLPATPGPHPAVVLLHGSGRGPREPMLHLARWFAEQGIAALAYDKRAPVGFGGDELTTLDSLAADAEAAIAFLTEQSSIDPRRIGLWGGSQGSAVAAHVAASTPVAFVVSVAGGGTEYTPFVLYQTRLRLRARGVSEPHIDAALAAVRARHAFIRGEIGRAALEARLAGVPEELGGPALPLNVPSAAEMAAWRRAGFLEGNAAERWRRVTVPVLAIWGGRDDRVPSEESARNVAEALRGNGDATLCIIPDADHIMLLPSGPGAGGSGGFVFPRLAPAYVEGMKAWVRERAGLASDRRSETILATRGCVPVPPTRGPV
jgi:dienelactone hydrolase